MGHWTGVKYIFNLNEQDSLYEEIINDMQKEIKQKYKEEQKDPGESFYANMSVQQGKIEYSSSSYKSYVSNDLSYELVKKIKKNIDTNVDKHYYIKQDNGENPGTIEMLNHLYGYAATVGQYMQDEGKAKNYPFLWLGSEKAMKKFYECLTDEKILEKVIRNGERIRLKRELKDKIYNVDLPCSMNLYNRDYNITTSNWKFDEILLAYFLVYGTEENHYIYLNHYGKQDLKLKEYLFADQYGEYADKWGTKALKDLTRYGVEFKDGLDSIAGTFNSRSHIYISPEATKEIVERWYQENKEEFTEVPKFSTETAYYLRDNYPATFEQFKNKLIELHNRQQQKLISNNMK